MAALRQKKIRVGLVGLNAPYAGMPTGTNWAAKSHLPYLLASSKYELVALLNSSTERAAKSIKEHGLDPEKVKAYGNPEDLAKDPNVDLVVSSIRADRHAASVIPSIKASKDIYVEWPVDANASIAKDLLSLAKAHKVRSMVGLQGSFEPFVKKIKSLIDSGEIGKLESSTLISKFPFGPTIGKPVDYFTERKVGGNPFTIAFGHTLEFVEEVLGSVVSHKSLLVNQYPVVSVINPVTNEILEENKPNDVPNQVVFDALMSSGAVFSYKFHNSATISPFAKPATNSEYQFPTLDWRIFGSKGEIRFTDYETLFLNMGGGRTKLEIWKADEGEVVEVKLDRDEFADLPAEARNIGRLFEAFAAGVDENGEKRTWYPDLEHAVKIHELIEEMYQENGFEV